MGLPLQGVRVLEFVHMVMGPACGLILADLGAIAVLAALFQRRHTGQGQEVERLIGDGVAHAARERAA